MTHMVRTNTVRPGMKKEKKKKKNSVSQPHSLSWHHQSTNETGPQRHLPISWCEVEEAVA